MKILMGATEKMKLYNVYRLCKKYIDVIEPKNIVCKDGKTYELENWKVLVKVFATLEKVPVLKEYTINYIKMVPEFVRKDIVPKFDSETARELNTIKSKMSNIMKVIIEFYESMNISSGENGIDIKLPPCKDLKDYINYLREFDFILSQCPFLQCKDETITFESVDVGSNWIRLAVTSTSACVILSNIGVLVDKAITLRSHYINIQQQEEVLKSTQLKNELAREQKQTFDLLRKAYFDNAITEIQKQCGDLKDGEEKGKAEKALEKLCELIDQGAEIYASIDAPEEVQVLFPEIQGNLELSGELIKYLEDKESEESIDNPTNE